MSQSMDLEDDRKRQRDGSVERDDGDGSGEEGAAVIVVTPDKESDFLVVGGR